ncbi:MAG: ABC transporter permease subunit, partial [Mesorhizobium sp.]
MIDLTFFLEIVPALLAGLPMTLQLAASSISIGFVMALLLALAQQGNNPVLVLPIRAFVAVFRGTPLLVQIFLIYYGLGQFRPSLQAIGLWWLFREPYWCAILALSLNTAAYGSEILRGAILAVPRGLIEAAFSFGMSRLL